MKATLQRTARILSIAGVMSFVYATSALAAATTGGFAGNTPGNLGLATGNGGDPVAIVTTILGAILNVLALIAVIVIVIAGIRLIVSQGEEEQRDKAKKTIFYAVAGLIIILFARVIVDLVTNWLAGQVGANQSQ